MWLRTSSTSWQSNNPWESRPREQFDGFTFVASGTRWLPRCPQGVAFPAFQPPTPDSHSFSTAIRLGYISFGRLFPDNSGGEFCPLDGEPRRFRVHRQAAGRHRPHHRRLRQAEEGRRAKLFRPLPLPRREDSVVFRPRHAPVLSLLRMRRLRRRLQLHPEDRKHHLPRIRPHGRPEVGYSAAQGELLHSRRSQRSPPARTNPRRPRARSSLLSRVPAPPRRRPRPRIPRRAAASIRK